MLIKNRAKYYTRKKPLSFLARAKLHYEQFNKPILGLFFLSFLEFFVFAVELINATCCVNKFHLTCVERV